MKIVLSEHNLKKTEGFEQVFNVSKIFVHNYNYKTFNSDIMLIKVSSRELARITEITHGTPDTLRLSSCLLSWSVRMRSFYIFNFWFVLQLSEPAQLNAHVQPATLPDNNMPPLRYDVCTVSGWGVTQIYSYHLSPVLRAVDVRHMPYCTYYYWGRITSNMLCAGSRMGGKDSCQVHNFSNVLHALCTGCLCEYLNNYLMILHTLVL